MGCSIIFRLECHKYISAFSCTSLSAEYWHNILNTRQDLSIPGV
uniref:Uncharacterized protein n=1 Tax=Rhizophora mucronata TaxID=61149 RepID=A0A2P2QGP1_RHIMU